MKNEVENSKYPKTMVCKLDHKNVEKVDENRTFR